MAIDLRGLKNFIRKINNARKLESETNNISSEIADKGVALARTAYFGSDISRAEVSKEVSLDGDYGVVAQGNGLSFEEFGTGYYAKGTYDGKLPTETINFESGGEKRSTKGWEYYYQPSHAKDEVDGEKGWWLGENFMTGESAGNQMYQTSVRLKEEIPSIVKKAVRELLE